MSTAVPRDGADPSSVRHLGELLDLAATASPSTEAILDGVVRLDWAGYRNRAGAIAAELRSAGVEPGDRVAVHLPKSVDAFASVHAILRVGAVVVPVDWFAPADHVARTLVDAEVAAVIGASATDVRDALRSAVGDVPFVDPGPLVTIDEPEPPVDRSPDDPAYIIYTSGSTGQPKGIVHTHRSALAYATRAAATYELGAEDRLANIAPIQFDQSTFELYAAPLARSAVLVVRDGVLRFPASLARLVADERITVWYSVPYPIVQVARRGGLEPHELATVRWVLYGGESFAPGELRAAMAAFPGARFSNVYGPAEVNHCTHHHLDGPPSGDDPVPIGGPWAGVEVLVVGPDGEPVAPPDPGELWVSGPTAMSGYWRRPDLTDAAFVEAHGRRWYRTGDLVRADADGRLVFLGRADNQVKVRGHRVELEAVDAVLADHPAVDACATVVDRRGTAGDRIVALVTPPPDDATAADIVRHARERLPRAATPDEVVGVGTLPRTSTGKIDRPASAALLAEPTPTNPPEPGR